MNSVFYCCCSTDNDHEKFFYIVVLNSVFFFLVSSCCTENDNEKFFYIVLLNSVFLFLFLLGALKMAMSIVRFFFFTILRKNPHLPRHLFKCNSRLMFQSISATRARHSIFQQCTSITLDIHKWNRKLRFVRWNARLKWTLPAVLWHTCLWGLIFPQECFWIIQGILHCKLTQLR